MEALILLLCPVADWARGRDWCPNFIGKTSYGAIAATPIFWGDWIPYLCFIGLFVLGASPGWGRPVGMALGGINNPPKESWQKGLLEDDRYALAFRGLMWGLPLALMYPFSGAFGTLQAGIAIAVSFYFAPRLAVALDRRVRLNGRRWEAMEVIRGALFGVLLAL